MADTENASFPYFKILQRQKLRSTNLHYGCSFFFFNYMLHNLVRRQKLHHHRHCVTVEFGLLHRCRAVRPSPGNPQLNSPIGLATAPTKLQRLPSWPSWEHMHAQTRTDVRGAPLSEQLWVQLSCEDHGNGHMSDGGESVRLRDRARGFL